MATTIRDVAEAAGVSPMAVSKVLHGKGDNVRVSKDKAALIRKIAADLRYQPNHLARSFRSKRTYTVGMVFEHFQRVGDRTGYFSQLLNGVMSATFPADYSLTICPKLIKSSARGMLFDGRFDGILWCRPELTDENCEAIETAPIPIVAMHIGPQMPPGVPTFCCDNEQALDLAVSHLADLGHRRIGFALDPENKQSAEAQARIHAFLRAKSRKGLGASPSDILIWDHNGADLPDYWQTETRHTALICFSESHAVSLLRAAETHAIRVPESLSVIGFDSTYFCETTHPRLTAINQPVEQMAYDAACALISSIEGEALNPQCVIYPCGLDIRESTARPCTS